MLNSNFKKYSTPGKLVGEPSLFPLERRIFHGISIGLSLLTLIYIPYNLFAGLYIASISALFFTLFFSYQYYFSRFRDKPHNNLLFGLTGIVIFGANYFTNSGIDGSTDLIWPSYLLLVLAISPYGQHLRWLMIYLVAFFGIHLFEFYHPEWISHPFVAGKGQFIDRVTAFPIPTIGIYIMIRFIRRSHDKERQATEDKTLAVELSKEQILLQKDQLEKNNIEKNKLMSIVSHDLRAPLVNIRSYLEMLSENEIDINERAMLEKALLKSTSNTLEMLSNLLQWSKSQMEGTSLNLVEVNVLHALLSTLEMEKMFASKKEIQLNYNIPANLTIIADVDMLQLVVRNLLSNAVKFTPQGGNIMINAEVEADYCKITITDTGSGIPKDKIDHIFSIKAVPSYGTNNEKGVGLGLVLCKEFIEQQGGSVGFESNLGAGSSFYIYLPLKKKAEG